MLLCIGSSFSFIIHGSDERLDDNAIIQFAKKTYETLGKRSGSSITKNEIIEWTKENIYEPGHLTINDIFSVIINGLDNTKKHE